ncbi:MAG: hypothetical protein RL150_719 [Candidatus Parcubacteria bacterium]
MKSFDPSLPEETVQKWVRDVQDHGCPESFGRIYEQFHCLVTTICRKHLPGRPEADVEDTVQTVFRKLWETKMRSFRGETSHVFGAWLKTITANRCTDVMRKLRRSVPTDHHSLTLLEVDQANEVRGHMPTDHIRYVELVRAFETALTCLSPRAQEVLRAAILGGKKYAEIAAELGLTVTNTGNILSFNIRRLREALVELHPEYARRARQRTSKRNPTLEP